MTSVTGRGKEGLREAREDKGGRGWRKGQRRKRRRKRIETKLNNT